MLRQSIQLTGIFPMLAVYGYHAYNHYEKDGSMYIHRPDPTLSTAENFLRMLRPDMKYTELEARVLDVALLLHAEHGGGNNSTFTTRVVTSSGTDTYSAIAAALCSLKGPRHGGANLMVMQMMQNIRENLHDTEDDEELEAYLKKLLHGEAFDRKGLIYGMGHAVYSLSDPREVVFKGYVEQLAHEKGRDKDLALYNKIETMAPQLIAEERKIFKGVSPNVDFYSGFVYEMLGIPMELYTPLFAVARVTGWSAHRIEELLSANKIIRPAYKSLGGDHEYVRRSVLLRHQFHGLAGQLHVGAARLAVGLPRHKALVLQLFHCLGQLGDLQPHHCSQICQIDRLLRVLVGLHLDIVQNQIVGPLDGIEHPVCIKIVQKEPFFRVMFQFHIVSSFRSGFCP